MLPLSKSINGKRIPLVAVFSFKLSAYEKLVLLYLLDQVGDSRSVSLQEFTTVTSLPISTVTRTLDSLVKSGYVLHHHRFEDGAQVANSYKLTQRAADQYIAPLSARP